MGGCRCTYRTCKVKSDGQTHMFHYPVFDKVRCHQWLANAQRLEFLNLKLSQLKNRVVCQNHFENDCFMNFKKDKLKFDAVPTKLGPYCDAPSDTDIQDEVVLGIALEDIENDYQLCCKEKKANFSVKYADFLTNSCDLVEPITLNVEGEVPKSIQNVHTPITKNSASNNIQNKVSLPSVGVITNKKHQIQPMLIVPPFSNDSDSNTIVTHSKDNKMIYEIEIDRNLVTDNNRLVNVELKQTPKQICNQVPVKKSNRIKIISEKKIFEPLAFTGKLEVVSPSTIICPRNRNTQGDIDKENSKYNVDVKIEYSDGNIKTDMPLTEPMPCIRKNNDGTELEFLSIHNNDHIIQQQQQQQQADLSTYEILYLSNNQSNTITIEQPSLQRDEQILLENQRLQTEKQTSTYENQSLETEQEILTINNQCSKNIDTSVQSISPNILLTKNKVAPERVAVIEEKRKFNKKLRDMIEFCLDDLDDQKADVKKQLRKNIIENNSHTKLLNNAVNSKKSLLVNSILRSKKDGKEKRNHEDSKFKKEIFRGDETTDISNKTSQSVKNFLSKDPNLPDVAEYNMSLMEARFKRMEDTLLRRIDQNTKQITDLKNVLAPSSTVKKSVLTQTAQDEHEYKRYLFHEISQFLTSDANSLIYEELFMNMAKHKPSDNIHPPKRRRNR